MSRTVPDSSTILAQALSRRHLPALDGLRALAVGVVIFYHGGLNIPGDLGVTGFFVLSGFLITWLLLHESGATGRISYSRFYLRRTLRIIPAYLAFILLSIIADFALGDPWSLRRVIAALTYTINYDNAFNGHTGPAEHAWSLAVEEQFYLLWPVLFVALARKGLLTWGLGGLILAVMVWRSLLYGVFDQPSSYVYNAFDTRFDSLAVGCLLAVLLRSPDARSTLSLVGAKFWLPILTLILLWISRTQLGGMWHYTVGFTVDSILCAALIVQMLCLHSSGMWSWLNHPLVTWIGTLSYPLYLWHIWGLSVADNIPVIVRGPMTELIAGVLVSLGLAAASYYGIERHFLRMKDRMTARSPVDTRPLQAPAAVNG